MNKHIQIKPLLLISAVVMAGCSSSYTVTKVDKDVPKILPAGGIYYSLPKTEIIVQIPAVQTVTKKGELSYKFKEYVNECKNGDPTKVVYGPDSEYEDKVELKLGQLTVLSRPVPDPEHRYRLDVTAESFSSFSHTVELTNSGLLNSTSTTVKDGATEAAIAAASSIADLAKISAGIVPAPAGAAASGTRINCTHIKDAADAIKDQTDKIAALERVRETLFLDKGLIAEPATLDKAIAYIDGRFNKIKKKHKKVIDQTRTDIKKETKFVLFATVTPDEFTNLSQSLTFSAVAYVSATKKDDSAPILPTLAGASATETAQRIDISKVKTLLTKKDLKIKVEPLIQYDDACPNPCTDSFVSGGYRYRLAASASVKITGDIFDPADSTTKKEDDIELASTSIPVAQYGPIAQLPEEFGGSEGSVSLSVFTDTGALKTVTVGAIPKLAANITAASGVLNGYLGAKETQKQAVQAALEAEQKAEKEALENQKLASLRKEKEELELLKAIKELRAALEVDPETD